MNSISKELKEEEKVVTDNTYQRTTAIRRQTEKWRNVKTAVKEEIPQTPV